MSLADAMNPNNLLCYEMNGAPLPHANGFPLRLIAPGWYGIANVKWLKRIEVRDTRFMGRFMARDYVTIREEEQDGTAVWTETSVGRSLLKSAPAKVTQNEGRYRIIGAAWGAPVDQVEVQIDGGPWRPADIDGSEEAEFAWKIWSLDWEDAAPGEHSITSRAIDAVRTDPAGDGRSAHRQQADLLGKQRPSDSQSAHRLTEPCRPSRETTKGETQCPAIWLNAHFPTG